MSAASVSVADGSGAAANITDGNVTRVTPGANLTVALQSSTGINRWILREDGSSILASQGNTPAAGRGYVKQVDKGGTFSVNLQLPQFDCVIPLYSSVWDGYNETHARIFLDCRMQGKVNPVYYARGVCDSNMSISAFVGVSGGSAQDGVTYAQGEVVLLSTQTSTIQNGLYVVGLVGGGTAPLTRHPLMATGDIIKSGAIVEVSEGTLYNNTRWKLTTTGNITVGTTAHAWYPNIVRGQSALVAGTFTISVPVLSATLSTVTLARVTANTPSATSGGYHPTTAGVTGFTAGVKGTGAVLVQACVVAGTINNADTSVLTWGVINF